MGPSDDIEYFIALCQHSDFRSRDEIVDGIRSSKYELTRHSSEIGVPAASMLETYRRRARHVGQFAGNSSHAKQMAGDVDAYVSELENAVDDEIKVWTVSMDRKSSYSIFEGIGSGKILGCIYGVDRRAVSSQEWDELWGHEKVE